MLAQLQRVIEVMDRLRSPGGCPWDAAQTHASLARYLLEETYEVLEAIDTSDVTLLREELGDVLLQVLFHARLAEELPPEDRFSIEDVAGDLADKLVRRHPHVFAGGRDSDGHGAGGRGAGGLDSAGRDCDAAVVNERWEAQKAVEKGRTSAVDGVPLAQPALALSATLLARAGRAGLDVDAAARVGLTAHTSADDDSTRTGEAAARADEASAEIGQRLFAVVRDAVAAGVDAEGALRRAARRYRDAILTAEQPSAGLTVPGEETR